MQFLDESLGKCIGSLIDHHINATEMVRGLDYIIHIHRLIFKTNGIGLKDESCLIVRQTATFNMVGVIGQVDLNLMIDTAGHLSCFLLPQDLQQCRCVVFLVSSFWFLRPLRNVPSFADKLGIGNSAVGTVIPHTSFGNPPLFSHFRNRYVFHSNPPANFLDLIIPHYRQNINTVFRFVNFLLPMSSHFARQFVKVTVVKHQCNVDFPTVNFLIFIMQNKWWQRVLQSLPPFYVI